MNETTVTEIVVDPEMLHMQEDAKQVYNAFRAETKLNPGPFLKEWGILMDLLLNPSEDIPVLPTVLCELIGSYVSSLDEHLHVVRRRTKIFFFKRIGGDYTLVDDIVCHINKDFGGDGIKQKMKKLSVPPPRLVSLDPYDSAEMRKGCGFGSQSNEMWTMDLFSGVVRGLYPFATLAVTKEITQLEARIIACSASCRDVRLVAGHGSNVLKKFIELGVHYLRLPSSSRQLSLSQIQNTCFPVSEGSTEFSKLSCLEADWRSDRQYYVKRAIIVAVVCFAICYVCREKPVFAMCLLYLPAVYVGGVLLGDGIRNGRSTLEWRQSMSQNREKCLQEWNIVEDRRVVPQQLQIAPSVPSLAAALPQSHFGSGVRRADQKAVPRGPIIQALDQEDEEQSATEHDRLIPVSDAKKTV